jgi:hypothetical protein
MNGNFWFALPVANGGISNFTQTNLRPTHHTRLGPTDFVGPAEGRLMPDFPSGHREFRGLAGDDTRIVPRLLNRGKDSSGQISTLCHQRTAIKLIWMTTTLDSKAWREPWQTWGSDKAPVPR